MNVSKKTSLLFCVILSFALKPPLHALPVDLKTAGPGNWAVLQAGDGNISLNAGGPVNGITGNVGINGTGTFALTGGTFVVGKAVAATNVNQVTMSGGATVSGGVTKNTPQLAQAATDAMSASTAASGLATSGGGVGVTTLSSTVTLQPGVYNLTGGINLSGGDIVTLAFVPGGSYVFNVFSQFKIGGGGLDGIFLAAGLSATEVLFNYVGTAAVAFTGGGAGDNSILNGILLSRTAKVNLSPGTVNGEIIAFDDIALVSGSDVHGSLPLPQVPEAGSTAAFLGLGLLAVGALRRKLARTPQ